MMPWVASRASAWVAGGTFTCRRPPPARKPDPDAHQAGGFGNPQVMPGFCSVCSCGGSDSKGKFCGVTSNDTPKPPRTAHLPLPVGSHAKPIRGMRLLVSVVGSRKSYTPGRVEIAFRACFFTSAGLLVHS